MYKPKRKLWLGQCAELRQFVGSGGRNGSAGGGYGGSSTTGKIQ